MNPAYLPPEPADPTLTPTACPDEGVWRAWLDREEPQRAASLASHLAGCSACQALVDELQRTAIASTAALDLLAAVPLPTAAEIERARQRLGWAESAPAAPQPTPVPPATEPIAPSLSVSLKRSQEPRSRMPISATLTRWRVAAVAAAVIVGGVAVVTPTGQAAASSFLAQFRSTQIQAVPVNSSSVQSLDRMVTVLNNLGTSDRSDPTRPSSLKPATGLTVAQADALLPFSIKLPDSALLPAGLPAEPKVSVITGNQYRYTFSKAKADAYFQSINRPDLSMPAKLDDSVLVVSVPSAAILEYGVGGADMPAAAPTSSSNTKPNALMLGESGELAVGTEGTASLDDIRAFLATLPNMPPEALAVLQNKDWTSTLPIPIPVDRVQWQNITVSGNVGGSGLLLNDNTGLGSAIIWHTGPQGTGQIFGLAGTMKATDLQRVANSLH